MAIRLSQLAERLGLEWRGADPCIEGVGTLQGARSDQISFLANPIYRKQLIATRAGAVILRVSDAPACPVSCLIAEEPYAAFARAASLFEIATAVAPGIHPSAIVAEDAVIAEDASIGAFVSIGARSRVDAGVTIGPGCVIGEDCRVGAGSELVARVTLVARVRLGQRVRVHPGAVLGADGFGLAMDQGHWIKVPQLGGVRIGDDCEIGANTCIDRGAIEDTVLEEDVRLDNQIQIGHNVVIGAHTAMAGCAAIAGSAKIGRYCLIGGGAGVVGHVEICDRTTISAMALVSRSIDEPGEYASGTPIQASRDWRRNAARFKRLDALARRIDSLAKD
jgi:UDP-3-O-[3-hydroxymyristoyl] glucosamine N-acyltransferase